MAKEQENDIDSLARMVAEGFKDVNKRFDEMGKEMGGRFDNLEKEVRQISQRIDRVVMPELDAHAARIKDLEVHTGIHA